MMKFILPLVMITSAPSTNFSSLSILLFMLTVLAFHTYHLQDYFMGYQTLMWDSLSFSLVSLTILILILTLLASLSNINIKKFKSSYILTSMSLLLILILTFSVTNLMLFYLLFEASLIPVFILILGWGTQPERLQAGVYMLIYTVLASLPLLISLLVWMNVSNSTSIFLLTITSYSNIVSLMLAYTFMLAFSVKLPLYMIHLWLPKAHVEAPVAGSMMLAAILLKLGGYGILRISNKCYPIYYMIGPSMISWSLIGGMMAAMMCFFQSDIKILIALSSVAHMSLVMVSALTFSSWGINSSLLIMIGHGFCSSSLFCIANVTYERINSRSLYLLKGLQVLMPSFSMMWFLMCISNMAAPPSLNLLGEMMSILSSYLWSSTLLPLLMSMVFLPAAYSLFLFSQTQYGKISTSTKCFSIISVREWLMLYLHWKPLNLLFLAPWIMQIYI